MKMSHTTVYSLQVAIPRLTAYSDSPPFKPRDSSTCNPTLRVYDTRQKQTQQVLIRGVRKNVKYWEI